MKDVPEIAPEIRGLLEEIVANPRSAIRLAPRRALRTWFDSGETIRATDVSRETAVRHLVAAHREELAALLREASWISYWKAPVLSHRPVGRDGKLFHPAELESNWIRRAERQTASSPPTSSDVQLLRQCIAGIAATQGYALAQASLSLVSSDRTRCYMALCVPWEKPRVAITLFRRLEQRAQPRSLRPDILLSLGARACYLGLFHEARELYRASSSLNPQSPYGWVFAFNLSCFLGDTKAALAEAVELGKTARPDDPRVLEDCSVLREWVKARSKDQLANARKTISCLSHEIPEVARVLCQVIEP
jgi:hypothetical protein